MEIGVMWTNEGKSIMVGYDHKNLVFSFQNWEDELQDMNISLSVKSRIEDAINDLLCESLWENED